VTQALAALVCSGDLPLTIDVVYWAVVTSVGMFVAGCCRGN
jgi:hypothetical protein